MHFQPKRGKYENLSNANLDMHELFYITDLKMIGVVDNNKVPQLLVEVLEYEYIDYFPKEGLPNKLYKTKNGNVYFFDGESYHPVNVNISYHGDSHSSRVKLGD